MGSQPAADTQANDLAPLNRIRVETALSRFPIHRLAKQGNVAIDLKRLTEAGQADFQWKVSYNTDFGQPGPLAYKVDTLVVNRRIDECDRPLPEIIKLGGLREICRDLGFTDHNTDQVKKALHQNASAYITAKLRYRLKNGREKWGEIGYTRYSVVFTGETLPNGSTADAVYIVLNASYRDLLNHVEVRPLDYDYLVELPPGPQRLYELLSFSVFGAIANSRPRAKLVYSEYCLYAPQTRYYDFDQVKKQMFKVHAPHRAAGYIDKVEYEETESRDGRPDWDIFYTPGPKAFVEHQAFSRRTAGQQAIDAGKAAEPPKRRTGAAQQQSLLLEEGDCDYELLVGELTRRGVADKKARELLAHLQPGQEPLDQIEWADATISRAPSDKFRNPPGLYIAVIRDNIGPPQSFSGSRKRRLWEQSKQARDAERAAHARAEIDYENYRNESIDRHIAALPPRQYQQMVGDARRQLKRSYSGMSDTQLSELAANWVRAEMNNGGSVRLMSFEEFRAQRKS